MFDLTNENKILVLLLLVVVAVYLLSSSQKADPIHNEGMLTYDPKLSDNFNDVIDTDVADNSSTDTKSIETVSNNSNNSSNSTRSSISSEALANYKSSSYDKGNRSAKSEELDKFFEGNYPQKAGNSGFAPMVENDGKFAAYTSGNTAKKLSDKDKFDPNSLLPREKNNEWFDDPFDQTTSKSSHLINIYRPMGVRSAQTTKARSHDLRPVPPNPKYPVSPFGNSSWEADGRLNDKALCG